MIVIYLLWFFGIVFALLFVTEIAVIVYRLVKKSNPVKRNIICAVIFAIISIGCSSTAVIAVVEKVFDSNITLSDIGKTLGSGSADVTSNAFKSFTDTWNNNLEAETSE